MEQCVVGCVQLRMRLPQSQNEIERNLLRFVRMAQTKRVRLLVFPQFAGLMTATPVTRGIRTSLLKQADQARRGKVSFWTRARARLAGSAAGVLRADFGRALEASLLQHADALWESYTNVFSSLARRYALTVVAGSTYLVDPSDGVVRHMALVFGPDGELLGQQSAVALAAAEHPLVEPGNQWQAIQTSAGRIGILIGDDMLYPEPARLLAYAGVEILIGMGASTYPVRYHRQRQGLLARVEENQLYGVMSFAVGHNPFTPGDEMPFMGRSLVAAPICMTPRLNGVLAEMGTDAAEGLITAEWSFPALHDVWVKDETPLRATMPVDVAGSALAAIYARRLTIDEATRIGELLEAPPALPEPEAGEEIGEEPEGRAEPEVQVAEAPEEVAEAAETEVQPADLSAEGPVAEAVEVAAVEGVSGTEIEPPEVVAAGPAPEEEVDELTDIWAMPPASDLDELDELPAAVPPPADLEENGDTDGAQAGDDADGDDGPPPLVEVDDLPEAEQTPQRRWPWSRW